MEQKENEQRRLSRRRSSGRSRWGRTKSMKRAGEGAVQIVNEKPAPVTRAATDTRRDKVRPRDDLERPMQEVERRAVEMVDPTQPRSIIPDVGPSVLTEKSTLIVPGPSLKAKYPLHNPFGPRWYKNHHLLHPQSRAPPSSSFSPSFPPMATALGIAQVEDVGRMPGPSRTPSGSPLPTPDSSQIRIADATSGVRTRKISQTAHDPVDLMDGTDPWGTNWHHHSPYDIGLNPSQGQLNISASPTEVSEYNFFLLWR